MYICVYIYIYVSYRCIRNIYDINICLANDINNAGTGDSRYSNRRKQQ